MVGLIKYTEEKLRLHINLLYNDDNKENSHYCWIKKSKLVSNQLSNLDRKKFLCGSCILNFSNETFLKIYQ